MTRAHPRYREDKATQAAARLLHLAGGTMNHVRLTALLYLVEREALTRFGAPVTFDSYRSLPHGLVLSTTLDRMNADEACYGSWGRYITPIADGAVSLRNLENVINDQLSRAEEELIAEVFARFGHLKRTEVVEYTQILPEWSGPEGSSIAISPDEILRHEGFSDEEITAIEAEWAEAAFASSLAA